MNISEFFDKSFHLTRDALMMLKKVDDLINEDFYFKNDCAVKKSCAAYIDEIKIHHNIVTSACAKILGFDELMPVLQRQAPSKEIVMRFISSVSWSGCVYFDELNNFLGYLIGRKKNIGWSTPPNWDGSEKMLEDYNTKNFK